jgi:hypothetical protein
MTAKEKTAIMEGVKNGIRNVWFSIFPVILLGINTTTGKFTINWEIVLAVAVVSIITTIDGIMHEIGKVQKDETLEKGLSFGV